MEKSNPEADTSRVSEQKVTDPEQQAIALKRELGLVETFGIILGLVIGSGIFISVRSVLKGTGSVGLSLVIWVVAGVVSTIEGLCFAELGTTFRKSGSTYAYLLEIYGSLPAYLYAFNYLFPSASAIQSLTFAEYAAVGFFGQCDPPELFIKLLGVAVLFLVAFMNILSVKGAVRFDVFLTIIKFGLCVVIAVGGLYQIAAGNTANISGGFQGSEKSLGRITLSLYSALWAYSGGFIINHATEEVKNVKRTIPISIVSSAIAIIVLYLLVNISYLTVLGVDGIMASNDAVATIWERSVFGTSFIMSLGVAISTFGSSVSGYLSYGRMFYVAAREGHMPEILSYVQVSYCTPIMSLLLRTVLATILILYTDLVTLINMYSLLSELFSAMAIVGLVLMRYRKPNLDRPFKVPLIIPIISVCKSLFLFLVPLIDSPVWEYMYVFAFLAVGLLLYVPFVHYKIELRFMRKFTVWIQILANVAPTKYNID